MFICMKYIYINNIRNNFNDLRNLKKYIFNELFYINDILLNILKYNIKYLNDRFINKKIIYLFLFENKLGYIYILNII